MTDGSPSSLYCGRAVLKDKLHQSSLEKPVIPCPVLERPLLCALPISNVPRRNPPFLLEALPILCPSQLFPDREACFFAAVLGQMVPWGLSCRLIPIMSDYVQATDL